MATRRKESFDPAIGDKRVQVPKDQIPYSGIAHLDIAIRGKHFGATGFLIKLDGDFIILTAGHNLYNESKCKAEKVFVRLGRENDDCPHGVILRKEVDVELPVKFLEGQRGYDYGIILLDEKDCDYEKLHFFTLVDPIENRLTKLPMYMNGYPGVFEGRGVTQMKVKLTTVKVGYNDIYYKDATSDGNSGSPIYILKGKTPIAIGIHSEGFSQFNEWNKATVVSTRLISGVQKMVQNVKDRYPSNQDLVNQSQILLRERPPRARYSYYVEDEEPVHDLRPWNSAWRLNSERIEQLYPERTKGINENMKYDRNITGTQHPYSNTSAETKLSIDTRQMSEERSYNKQYVKSAGQDSAEAKGTYYDGNKEPAPDLRPLNTAWGIGTITERMQLYLQRQKDINEKNKYDRNMTERQHPDSNTSVETKLSTDNRQMSEEHSYGKQYRKSPGRDPGKTEGTSDYGQQQLNQQHRSDRVATFGEHSHRATAAHLYDQTVTSNQGIHPSSNVFRPHETERPRRTHHATVIPRHLLRELSGSNKDLTTDISRVRTTKTEQLQNSCYKETKEKKTIGIRFQAEAGTKKNASGKYQNVTYQCRSNLLFSPVLKRKSDSLMYLEEFIKKDMLTILPACIEESHFFRTMFIRTLERLTKSGMVLISSSLCELMHIYFKEDQPEDILFEVFGVIPGLAPFVLCVTEQNTHEGKVKNYTTHLAQFVIDTVRKFTDEKISCIYGTIEPCQFETPETFKCALDVIREKTARFCIPRFLFVDADKLYEIARSCLFAIAALETIPNTCKQTIELTLGCKLDLLHHLEDMEKRLCQRMVVKGSTTHNSTSCKRQIGGRMDIDSAHTRKTRGIEMSRVHTSRTQQVMSDFTPRPTRQRIMETPSRETISPAESSCKGTSAVRRNRSQQGQEHAGLNKDSASNLITGRVSSYAQETTFNKLERRQHPDETSVGSPQNIPPAAHAGVQHSSETTPSGTGNKLVRRDRRSIERSKSIELIEQGLVQKLKEKFK